MAGTANNFRLTGRVLGPGLLWGGLPVPSAGSRLTLATVDTDGFITPDATANPTAYPIGATKSGVTLSADSSRQDFTVDEILAPVDSRVTLVGMSIEAALQGIADPVVAKLSMAGFGTQSSATGYVQNTVGYIADNFTGVAFIAPMREDPTKVLIFHIYKAINQAGIKFTVNKGELGSSPVNFKGYAVTTRTPADQVGNYWWQA